MCGISGAIGDNSRAEIERSLDSLSRRGPDSKSSITFDNGLTLGATRLAMTDPHPRSNQPFCNLNTSNALVFNGEIYNFQDIRNKLERLGISFHTKSDTEVVLRGLEYYGTSIISDFQGMFAIAYYDSKKNELILARDFLGKKPLYYGLKHNKFIFSSQLSVVKEYLNINKLSESALSSYLHLGYILDPHTIYDEIKSVKAGEVVRIDLNKLEITSSEYIIPRVLGKENSNSIRQELEHAVRERVAGHEQFAISLSGGIDSTIIAIMSAKMGLRPTAYTAKWSDADKFKYNIDSEIAIQVARKLDIEIKTVEMPAAQNIPEKLSEYVIAMQEPNANPTGLSMMELYNVIEKDGMRLVITGDGSDEIFGGYARHHKLKNLRRLPQFSTPFKTILNSNLQSISKLQFLIYPIVSTRLDYSWLFWHQIAKNYELYNLFGNRFRSPLLPKPIDLAEIFETGNSRVANMMFKDLQIWLNMESNRKLDRISMWHSIEARSPFQSERLINVGYSCMRSHKFENLEKYLLKTEYPELSNFDLSREKIGFSSPLGHWLRTNPRMIENSFEVLSGHFELDLKTWNILKESPTRGDFRKFTQLWSLVVLSAWIKNVL